MKLLEISHPTRTLKVTLPVGNFLESLILSHKSHYVRLIGRISPSFAAHIAFYSSSSSCFPSSPVASTLWTVAGEVMILAGAAEEGRKVGEGNYCKRRRHTHSGTH